MNLTKLLAPESVAIVGASNRPGPGSRTLRNLLATGYKGRIYPVNPKYEEVFGLRAYSALESLPEVPDCVVLAVAASLSIDVLRKAGELGTRAAVIYSSGFGEMGAAGRGLEERLRSLGEEFDLAVCGPNCMGPVNFAGAALSPGSVPPEASAGNVAIVAQSGSVSVIFTATDRFDPRYVISSGNQTVTDAVDYLRFLVSDPEIDVVAMFQESIRRPREFLRIVEEAHRRQKAVIMCKTGRSPRGADAALAHTGAMVDDYMTFKSVFEQQGVMLVEDLDELLELTVLLSGVRMLPPSTGIGIINCSGGENALILDLADKIGLEFPSLSEDTMHDLRNSLPLYGTPANPLDVTGTLMFDPVRYKSALMSLANDENVGLIASVHSLPSPRMPEGDRYLFWHMLEALCDVSDETGKPAVLLTAVPDETDEKTKMFLKSRGVMLMQGLGNCLLALKKATDWFDHIRQMSQPRRRIDPDMPFVEQEAGHFYSPELSMALKQARGKPLGEATVKAILASKGFPFPSGVVVNDANSAHAAALGIGTKVVLKISSPDITHKTDIGGVALGVDPDDAATVFQSIMERVTTSVPDADIEGVLVEEMIEDGVEFILGMKRHPDLGAMILCGLGGIYTEILGSFVLRRAPLSHRDVHELVHEAPGSPLLGGVRGRPPLDEQALMEVVWRLSQFAVENEGVREIDLNPVVVLPQGKGVRILDALIVQ